MTSDHPAAQLLAATEASQAEASDPTVSAWVSANAGAGKTHVLKLRVLRLLLTGTAPERILCLTYTKAAAAEMAQRVFNDLAEWATADDEELRIIIAKLVGAEPKPEDLTAARQLFARAIETPGGLKIQTIHAFCERLLQRFPLEAGVSPGFAILDDDEAAELRVDAVNRTLAEAHTGQRDELGAALRAAVRYAADERFDQLLRAALAERDWLAGMSEQQLQHVAGEALSLDAFYRMEFAVRPEIDRESLIAEMSAVMSDAQLSTAANALQQGGKRDQDLAKLLLDAARMQDTEARAELLRTAFLTKDGAPRSDRQFVSKDVRTNEPGITDTLIAARDRLHDLARERLALDVVSATCALVQLTDRVMQHYFDAKARRSALDFDDLIERTTGLLSHSNAADWVLYKLDGGLDHILVDEAQDTSPMQWRIVETLANEFFSGQGANEGLRTIFAVGDEKQSIYSFQGAAPKMFATAGARFEQLAKAAGCHWRSVPLNLSFRTVTPLLGAVDRIFADPRATPGLTATDHTVRHAASRIGEAGRLEIWPTIKPEEIDPSPAFAPLEEMTAPSPVKQLAARIADQIDVWLKNNELLISQGRPIKASDILILVRKRQPFAPEMVRALKARGIPVAGADRIRLTDQIAIRDLVALADFLVLPEDDLSLAAVLKSPLFNLDDDDLLQFAPDRKGALWTALLAAAQNNDTFEHAANMLKRWRAFSDFIPPYEFFATLLDRDGCRAQLLSRLGPDAADPIDEFMNLALQFDDQAPASLQGFICWLRDGERIIKRDMEKGREEVRVMTVHGAKGLEAPIVFLPDTCSAPGAGEVPPLVHLTDPDQHKDEAGPVAWAIKASSKLPQIKAGRSAKKRDETEENNRLLYVALTRARDRIYVAGFEGKTKRPDTCWYDIIDNALSGQCDEITNSFGDTVWRLESPQTVEVSKPKTDAERAATATPRPELFERKAPTEPQLVIPLAPSRILPLEADTEGEPLDRESVRTSAEIASEPASPSPRAMARDYRFLRGLLTHALLEHLPNFDDDMREAAARAFVTQRGDVLSQRVQDSIVREVLAVMRAPDFAAVFGPGSAAEVPIVAEIARPEGEGPPLRLTGQIDRLSRSPHEILIIDYKTNRPPPREVDQIADSYLLQMAAYRLAIQQIFQDRPVHAAILWTDGARLMPIPDEVLDDHQQRLWSLKTSHLDGV